MDVVLRDIAQTNDRIRILNKKISSKPKDETYKFRIELGRMVAQELSNLGNEIARDVHRTLSKYAVESKLNKNLTDDMILNIAFLVDREKEAMFDAGIDQIEKKYGDRVSFRYVTAPPYNFVNFRVGR
jgi:hypothetical protein